ncbi:hypothetical protein IAT38_002635 [Cryptococcus sp. DSM 104549]
MTGNSPYLAVLWACISSWYYGFHLSELNFPILSLTCTSPSSSTSLIPQCLNMDESTYGLVTAVFTVGGLLGSLASSWVVKKQGLKGGIAWTGWINLLGSACMGVAPHWVVLAFGRLVVGAASGLAICLVPPYLSHIAKSSPSLASKSGQIGTLNQMAIVLGVCSAQVAGLLLTGEKGDVPGSWRWVVTISAIVAVGQIVSSPSVPDPNGERGPKVIVTSPTDDLENGRLPRISEGDEAASPLLPDTPSDPHPPPHPEAQLTLRQILSNPALRGPALLCAATMALQQLSGVNAVLFYSTPVLRPLLPTSAGVVGVSITVVNAVMTLPAVFLMDRLGRKTLILSSIAGMASASVLLAIGLNDHHKILSAVSIIAFIASFSIGLGPVPFLLVSDLAPPPAVPALSSLALSTNWITNFLVALFFLPLRDALSSPSGPGEHRRSGEGRVFYVFTAVLVLGAVMVLRGLKVR